MYKHFLKRIIDIMVSICGLIVLGVPMLVIAGIIKSEDPGPALFRQKRVGKKKGGKITYFELIKFRSMRISTPHDMPTHMLSNPEQYLLKCGKTLRKYSLDELPQMINILKGDMAIVGPRPALWNQDDLVAEREKYSANDCKPGLTGWAQINGRDELEIPVKAKFDGEYAAKEGLLMDARCFLGTIFKVFRAEGVIEGGTGEMKKVADFSSVSSDVTKKKILVICQYYKPEPFRISDICEEMVRRGHEIQVVTGYPNYPEGIIYEGYGKGNHIDEVINGVKVHRCYTIPRDTGVVKRMMNYYSYAISSTGYVLSKECVASNGRHFDFVFCNQLSPVMMADAAIAYKKKYKVPVVMYCLDLWPESLLAGGIKRESLIYKYYHHVSKNIYRKMDKILVTSRMFTDYLMDEFDIQKERINYLPQYAEGIFEQIPERESDGMCNLMFAGNIGEIQSVETVIKAAELLKDEPVKFHIVGGGTDLNRLQEMAKNLDNVVFYGRRVVTEMPKLYTKADAMLVTLAANPVLSMTLPGKVQSYMAAGKPIIGAIDGETKKVIDEAECGLCGHAENADELADNVRKFICCKNKSNMGFKSRKYYEENFEEKLFMDNMEKYSINIQG